MTNEQLCEYMKNYIEKDKTKRAIMLTAPWGKGKSYFVKNELEPYLKANGKYQTIVISLYGINSIAEISKSIYITVKLLELKQKVDSKCVKFFKKRIQTIKNYFSKLVPPAKIVAWTVIKGVVSFYGVNFSLKDFQELFNSVDLKGKLIVFEDIERSKIDIIDFLGYVNSLVEQDGVKVLLISNEDEITHYSQREVKEDEDIKLIKEYDERSLQYLKSKEKTVSDTIYFSGNPKNAIENIIKEYECKQFSWALIEQELNSIVELLYTKEIYNLRTFIYACQKTCEIYEKINEKNLDKKYLKCIFYGIILFSNLIKNGEFPGWEGTPLLSSKLANNEFPLFRFCYEYIRWYELDISKVDVTIKAYEQYRTSKEFKDNDFDVISNYYILTEENILNTLKNIDNRLDSLFDFPVRLYLRLAYYLAKFHFLLNYDFSSILNKMINNLKDNSKNVDINDLMFLDVDFSTKDEEQLFNSFKEKIKASMQESQQDTSNFSYNPNDISSIKDKADTVRQQGYHRFISLYNLEKLVDMLFKSTAKQIDDFRAIMFSVYRNATKNQFEIDDCKFMENMITSINNMIKSINEKEENKYSLDKIQLLQIDYLCRNLQAFINQLS